MMTLIINLNETYYYDCELFLKEPIEDAWAYIFLMNNTMTGTVYTDCNKRKKRFTDITVFCMQGNHRLLEYPLK